MKERPILFSGPMVTGILNSIKDRTRRLNGLENINKDPDAWEFVSMFTDDEDGCYYAGFKLKDPSDTWMKVKSQYGAPGDYLWVRESWCDPGDDGYPILYRADYPKHWDAKDTEHGEDVDIAVTDFKWKSSIYMFRDYSRIDLKITSITTERLQDISNEDALKEGVSMVPFTPNEGCPPCKGYMVGNDDGKSTLYPSAVECFKNLWTTINDPDSWDSNPYVFVIEFERIKP